jgi:hypothetical protein
LNESAHDKDVTIPPPTNPLEPNREYNPEAQSLESIPSTQYLCPVCGRAFTAQNMLTIHIDVAHKKRHKK